jgi:GT2 family glycosyltransferase
MSARQPFVSVIIPVFNDAEALALTLTALQQQTYPATRFEVIVVDNASTDDTVAVIGHFPAVQLLYEHQYLGSPYSCRNRGLEVAQGEIIAFLDATCEPVPRWLEAAVAAFAQTGADLVGGRVKFKFAGKRPSIGEFYDSITNIQMKQSIQRRNQAKTANLLVRRAVIEGIGLFWLTHYAVRVVSHAAYLWGWLRLKIRAGKQDQQP